MAKTLRKTVPARDLPTDWQQEGRFAPEDQVLVTVEPEPPRSADLSPLRFLGAGKGLFASSQEIDDHLQRQRDEWRS